MSLLIRLLLASGEFVLMLVCGVFWGLYFALSRSYQVFTPGELAKVARTIVANLEVPMRNISLLCLTLLAASLYAYPAKTAWNFYTMIASLFLITGSLVITTAIEVPINRQVITWTDDNYPSDWEDLRRRWQYFNVVRTVMALLSFAMFTVALAA